jgi:Lrp/AsnC family transcriptional regulator for asnA, asnC and gidA
LQYVIDDLDRGLIQLLSKDGRMAFTEIASALNVTEKTVRLRYKNLIENKILEVVGVVNPIAIGLKSGAIIQIKALSGSVQQVIEDLKKIQVIRYVTLTSGEYPLLAQIAVQNEEEIMKTILEIHNIKDILSINTIVQLQVYKNTFEYL